MNKERAIKNIITSVIFKVVILIISLIARRYLINEIGSEATGLFSLYTNILGFLSIAELGVGTAITFSMYKPIIENDIDRVSALYRLYRKIYYYIFIIVLVVGLLITPIIPKLAKDNSGTFNIYLTYILFLLSMSTSYLYAHQTSFINAKLDNYVTVTIASVGKIIEHSLQIVLLVLTKSFALFLVAILISNLIQWLTTKIIFKLKYQKYINESNKINKEDKLEIIKNTKAMFFHKIGGILVNATDSIVISVYIGVISLGVYSNYITLMTGMVGIITLVFTSIISVIGHSFAKNTKEVIRNQFKIAYFINYIIGFIFFMLFYLVIDQSITFLFKGSLVLDRGIVFVITLNYFIQFMRQATLSFRDASGTFYRDRYKPLAEGFLNLILSILFVKSFGISGVLVATIITNLLITHIIEPYVLYKYGLEESPKKYYIYNYIGIIIFVIAMLTTYFIPLNITNKPFLNIVINGLSSLLVSGVIFVVLILFSKEFRNIMFQTINETISTIKKFFKKDS